jgi:uncharacterized protein
MPITEAEFGSSLPVDGYGPGFFRVAGVVYRGGVVVEAGSVGPWGGYADRAPLLALADKVDVLFVGTGPEIAFLPRDLVDELGRVGLMAEPMSSPSSARSYNVLLSEGRRVACALLPMPGDVPA